jgi:hypothetical protein
LEQWIDVVDGLGANQQNAGHVRKDTPSTFQVNDPNPITSSPKNFFGTNLLTQTSKKPGQHPELADGRQI